MPLLKVISLISVLCCCPLQASCLTELQQANQSIENQSFSINATFEAALLTACEAGLPALEHAQQLQQSQQWHYAQYRDFDDYLIKKNNLLQQQQKITARIQHIQQKPADNSLLIRLLKEKKIHGLFNRQDWRSLRLLYCDAATQHSVKQQLQQHFAGELAGACADELPANGQQFASGAAQAQRTSVQSTPNLQ